MYDAPQPQQHQAEHAHPATVEATADALRQQLAQLFGTGVDLDLVRTYAERYAARVLAEGIKRAAAVTPERKRASDRTLRALKTQAVQDAGLLGVRGLRDKTDQLWQLFDTAATFAATFAPLML